MRSGKIKAKRRHPIKNLRSLFPEREFATSLTGLQFVFIDETGTGHWVLRYQSDFVNY